MSERITDSELCDYETSDFNAEANAQSLVAEVRRLRALIASADGACCLWADDHKDNCPLIVEARAIREEQKA